MGVSISVVGLGVGKLIAHITSKKMNDIIKKKELVTIEEELKISSV